jgi:cytochrome c oxidase subunit 2
VVNRVKSARHYWISLAVPLLAASCSGWQSALDPHGPDAWNVRNLIWLFAVVASIVWAMVMLALAGALWRRRSVGQGTPAIDLSGERRAGIAASAATVATVLTIGGLTLASYLATRSLSSVPQEPLAIRVRAYQWWWEVSYIDEAPARNLTTANEIHVPAGRPVSVELTAVDVIHSFWVPNLAGKQDLIPGRDNRIAFTATTPGLYRGQCAEFCGLQHAHMSLFVVADPPDQFEVWRNLQLGRAADPVTDEQRTGREIVVGKPCASCHTVRGTSAAGVLGPDLTHMASRLYIAAGLLATTRGSIAAWVADPQTIKPGNNMPMVPLTGDELRAVSAYLGSLK